MTEHILGGDRAVLQCNAVNGSGPVSVTDVGDIILARNLKRKKVYIHNDITFASSVYIYWGSSPSASNGGWRIAPGATFETMEVVWTEDIYALAIDGGLFSRIYVQELS